MKMDRLDACDLSRLIEKTYGHEFNVPYLIMMDQRLIERSINPIHKDEKEFVEKFKEVGEAVDDIESTFQALLNDLCSKKLLKKGDYLIEFDD